MFILLSKTCKNCVDVEKAIEAFPRIKKYYVVDGNIAIDETTFEKMDSKIPALPALVTETIVYVGSKFILDFLEKLKTETGVI